MNIATQTAGNPAPKSTATPWLATVPVLASIYADAGKTPGAIRMDVFKADDRLNSRGETLKGNGLAEHGAIVRRGRKVLIDVHRYGNWLAGRPPVNG
jgi:hypothetical protein